MDKKLKLMRFWLFGVFVIVFGAFLAFYTRLAGGNIMNAFKVSWMIYLLTAVLCVGTYYLYKMILNRKK